MSKQRCLEAALEAVTGDRALNYGQPEDNFQRIADLWNAYSGGSLKTHDVAAMMALVKIARVAHSPTHLDSWIDIAGYAACGHSISDQRRWRS